jgi:large subunit ribosomal protein L24
VSKIKSSKPRKQRKKVLELPLHLRKKLVSAHLSKELRKQLKKRSLPVRKGDKVRVLRGKHKGFTGKIARVDYRKGKVFIEKLTRKKADGTEVLLPLNASNLLLLEIVEDEKRLKQKIGKGVK